MARRKDSTADHLILAPWWVSAIVVPVGYLILTAILQQLAAGSEKVVYQFFAKTSVSILPIVLIGCGFFALLSAIRRWRVRKEFESQSSLGTIREMHWKSFEDLVGEMFRRKGYSVA